MILFSISKRVFVVHIHIVQLAFQLTILSTHGTF